MISGPELSEPSAQSAAKERAGDEEAERERWNADMHFVTLRTLHLNALQLLLSAPEGEIHIQNHSSKTTEMQN